MNESSITPSRLQGPTEGSHSADAYNEERLQAHAQRLADALKGLMWKINAKRLDYYFTNDERIAATAALAQWENNNQ